MLTDKKRHLYLNISNVALYVETLAFLLFVKKKLDFHLNI